MKKDKNRTMQRLIAAVGSVIREQGFGAVGVNAVARKAGVDKVLLYRYFGDLETLLKEYVSASDSYRTAASTLSHSIDRLSRRDIQRLGSQILLGQLRRLRDSPDLKEIYRWELSADNPVTRSLAEQREREGIAVLSMFAKRVDASTVDLPAMIAVILAGGIHLTLRAKSANVFNGVELGTPAGWERIERAIDMLVALTMARATIVPPAKTRAPTGSTRGSRKRTVSRAAGKPSRHAATGGTSGAKDRASRHRKGASS